MKKHLAQHKARVAITGILFLLVSQYFALLHSTEHYFHEVDSLCSIYQSVEHSTPGVLCPDLKIEIPQLAATISIVFTSIQTHSHFLPFQSRAPPVI